MKIKERGHSQACFDVHTQKCVCTNGKLVTVDEWRELLASPVAERGFRLDMAALDDCDAVVYVLPCGRSASWEFGYAMGAGKPGYVIAFEDTEPELMFREARILANMDEVFEAFGEPKETP